MRSGGRRIPVRSSCSFSSSFQVILEIEWQLCLHSLFSDLPLRPVATHALEVRLFRCWCDLRPTLADRIHADLKH
jgi:hypothetical protein